MMDQKQEKKLQITLTQAHNNFEKGLNTHAFFKVNDHMLADDLTQDTYMKTWRYLIKTGKIDTMKAFLYHVLNGLIIDEYRKRKTSSLDTLIEKGYEPKDENTQKVFDIMDGKMAMLLIPSLPERYQKVMNMKYVRMLSLQEISLITKQSKNTIAVQLHRGLKKLKILAGYK